MEQESRKHDADLGHGVTIRQEPENDRAETGWAIGRCRTVRARLFGRTPSGQNRGSKCDLVMGSRERCACSGVPDVFPPCARSRDADCGKAERGAAGADRPFASPAVDASQGSLPEDRARPPAFIAVARLRRARAAVRLPGRSPLAVAAASARRWRGKDRGSLPPRPRVRAR